MMASDTQKYFVPKMAKEYKVGKILIKDGWFRKCRNTNYTGEAMLYSSFAICSQSWFPWFVHGAMGSDVSSISFSRILIQTSKCEISIFTKYLTCIVNGI